MSGYFFVCSRSSTKVIRFMPNAGIKTFFIHSWSALDTSITHHPIIPFTLLYLFFGISMNTAIAATPTRPTTMRSFHGT